MTYTIEKFPVGGWVRDRLLGVQSKDLDYTVVINGAGTVDEAWEALRDYLTGEGYTIFQERPQFLTYRAKHPQGHEFEKITADFVLARAEGPYTDGRHPDWVKPGTLADDQARRDFTVNSIAMDAEGNFIDPWDGVGDIDRKLIRAVGNAHERMIEDPLRVYRAVRFAITKGFVIDADLKSAMRTLNVLDRMDSVSTERIRDELFKMFAYDPIRSMHILTVDHPELAKIAFMERGLWPKITSEKR